MDLIDGIGIFLGIISLGYAFYATRVLSKGIKVTSLIHIRTLVNRMEEEKKNHTPESEAHKAMHHTQQELEAVFKSLQITFGISDEDAPR